MKTRLKPDFANSKNNSGFSLIEMMIALAILSIGILGAASMQITSINSNASASRVTTNVTWANDQMEDLMMRAYTDTDLSPGSHNPGQASDGIDNDSDGEIDESSESGAISVRWVVTPDRPVTNAKILELTVTRTGVGGTRSITLTRVIPQVL